MQLNTASLFKCVMQKQEAKGKCIELYSLVYRIWHKFGKLWVIVYSFGEDI